MLASISFSLVLAAATVQTADPTTATPTPHPTPMSAPPREARPAPATAPPSIVHDGNGWCVFADDAHKQSFYSAVFPGDPDKDITPREDAFQAYITRTYPERSGAAVCSWDEWSTESEAQETEQEAESSDQIKGYQMTETQWKPGQDE